MYDALFTPLPLNGVDLVNRVVRTAHGTRLTGDDLIAYHEARAQGGVGLTILEMGGVHATSLTPGIAVDGDDVLTFYGRLMNRLEKHDMRIFQQLGHGGSGYGAGLGPELWSASAVPDALVRVTPRAMTVPMIDEIVTGFAAAARRVVRGGLHGIEIHAAHGYLLGQFLSPALNHRDDAYGGSPENRLRLLREILEVVRSEVGSGFHVGVRLSTDFIEDGLDEVELARIAGALDGDVDHINVSVGSHFRFHKMLDTMEAPLGYELPIVEAITRAVSAPTIVSGRIMGLDDATRVVESGAADMVSLVRALIADPELVNKARTGNAHLVRPCVGSNVGCIGKMKTVGRLGCVVNIAAGNEVRVPFEPSRAPVSKRVLVVGGGPAGMEAARTAALRGHQVTLHELRRQLGGQVAIAASSPRREDLGAITGWLEGELVRLGVTIRRGSFVDADLVIELGADEVVVATGTHPTLEAPQIMRPAAPIAGAEQRHVFTSWDVLGHGRRPPGGTRAAVVFDDTGTFEAVSVAVALVEGGAAVTFASSLDSIGARVPMPEATIGHSRELLLGSAGFDFVPSVAIDHITADGVVVAPLGTTRRRTLPADLVAVVSAHRLNSELGDELSAAGVAFRSVGDVNGRQDLQVALREGADAGRAI